VIETGTYRGTSTEFLSAVFGAPVTSIEANPRLFSYSSRRLAAWPDITVEFGDSRVILRRVADGASGKSESVFAYLDAHWEEDLPLSEELEIIASGWSHAVAMIDDFQVQATTVMRSMTMVPERLLPRTTYPSPLSAAGRSSTRWPLHKRRRVPDVVAVFSPLLK